MELSIEDVRTLIGSYVLEMLVKDKEIKSLKAQIEELTSDKVQASKLHAVTPDVLIPKER